LIECRTLGGFRTSREGAAAGNPPPPHATKAARGTAIDAPGERRVIDRNDGGASARIISAGADRGVRAIAARPVIAGTNVRSIHTQV